MNNKLLKGMIIWKYVSYREEGKKFSGEERWQYVIIVVKIIFFINSKITLCKVFIMLYYLVKLINYKVSYGQWLSFMEYNDEGCI